MLQSYVTVYIEIFYIWYIAIFIEIEYSLQ